MVRDTSEECLKSVVVSTHSAHAYQMFFFFLIHYSRAGYCTYGERTEIACMYIETDSENSAIRSIKGNSSTVIDHLGVRTDTL